MTTQNALDALRLVLDPFIRAALPTDHKPAWAHLRIAASPLEVILVSADAAGTERAVHAIVGVAVLDAVKGVLDAVWATLTPAQAQETGARLERAPGKLWLVVDVGVTTCTMLLETDNADEAGIIGRLAVHEVRH